MSTIKSSSADLTLNADGSGNDIILQSNASQIGSLTAEGVLTATSFAGSGASLTGLTASQMPAGSVIQHTYASTRTQYVSTSTTAAAIAGLAVAITPTDATNNLLVTVGVAINKRQAATGTRLWLYRDIGGAGFTIMDGVPIIYYGGYDAATSADSHNNVFFQYLDSSYDSTSEVNYKLYYALSNGSGTIKINSNGSLSTITVTEHKV